MPAPTYQWLSNGTKIAGGTNALLYLTNFQASRAGSYEVQVANGLATTTTTAQIYLDTPLRIENCAVHADGCFGLNVGGPANQTYRAMPMP